MEEEIKKKIDEMKKDNASYKLYVKSFCDSKKANELFSNNEEFNNLKDIIVNKKNKKEDEYF